MILLSDTFLANSSEPWLAPRRRATCRRSTPALPPARTDGGEFLPYLRDESLARPWALPGTPGLQHGIGGLEKEDGTGNISYEPENHALMTRLRAERIAQIADDIRSWRSTTRRRRRAAGARLGLELRRDQGRRRGACAREGKAVAVAHLHHLTRCPRNTGDVVRSYRKVLVPEMNIGQLVKIIRADFLVDAESYTKVEGLPFFAEELEQEILERL